MKARHADKARASARPARRGGGKQQRVFVESRHDIPLVEMVVIARTGSQTDSRGSEGALALAMRSLRRGAGSRSAQQIDESVDAMGAALSCSADVSSSAISVTVIRRNLEPMVELLSDLLLRPTLPVREVAQVARETSADIIDSQDDDRMLAHRWFRRTLFAGHPYGRPTQGTLETIAQLSREDARDAFSRTFVRNNVVFAAAGDISAREFERIVQDSLSDLPHTRPPDPSVPDPRKPKGRRLVIVDKPERTQTQVYIGGLGSHPFDPDHVALSIGNVIFGGTFTARLMREVRSKRGWSYGASSRLGRDRARDAWNMWTFPAATDAASCIRLQIDMLEQLIETGVTERELSFAKSFVTRGWAFEVDTAAKRVNQRIDEEVVPLPANYYRRYLDRVRALTRKDVNEAIRRRLSAKDMLVSIVATADQVRSAVENAIEGLEETIVVPHTKDTLGR